MRFELKDYQRTASGKLLSYIRHGRAEAAAGEPQAIVLSSPTGSGKTAIVTDVMERVYTGHDGRPGDSRAVFLWLSDSPELNEQSRQKVLASSHVFGSGRLVTVDSTFDAEHFEPGRIYFLNTQKLSKDARLTKKGDGRTWPIWTTIENTAKRTPDSFYVILDEAHRGMRESKSEAAETRAENARLTIVQRFIKGDSAVGLAPVPLVLGMSATPDRFVKVLSVLGASRALRIHTVDPDEVRASGLIKDRIKLDVADESQPMDLTLLKYAADKFLLYTNEWKSYCAKNKITPAIVPVMVVQVEDSSGPKNITRTEMGKVVDVLMRTLGELPTGSLAHCFQEATVLEERGQTIRYIEPSRIQADPSVRVVFFKTALSTGWDCPRAEVMMSFRKAKDETSIAQLVGRMVRTPLAQRIGTNDLLNSVVLVLPHYDEEAVEAIIKKLESPESGSASKVERAGDLGVFRQAKGKEECFAALAQLPTYKIERRRRVANTQRLIRLSRMLDMDGLTEGAQTRSKDHVVDVLKAESARLRKDAEFADRITGRTQVQVRHFEIEYGEWKADLTSETHLVDATPENIDEMFESCRTVLGEGLHLHYWRSIHDPDHPLAARLELFCLLQDHGALHAVQEAAEREFERLFGEYREAIHALDDPRREMYYDLRRKGAAAVAEPMVPRENIEVRRELPTWTDHLYVDEHGRFGFKANTWEKPILKEAMKDKNFLGWFRNYPRKDWSFCVPYGASDEKGFFPDLLVFRREGTKVKVDIYDPHGDQYADAPAKAAGLARFAHKHGDSFGRIEVIRMKDGHPQRLPLHDSVVRNKVRDLTDDKLLDELFDSYGK